MQRKSDSASIDAWFCRSLSGSTLAVLGLANETNMQQPHVSSSLHSADSTSSSIQGATPT